MRPETIKKHEKFIGDVLDGVTPSTAYKKHIATNQYTKNAGHRAIAVIQKHKMEINEVLDAKGLTLERCTEKLVDLVDADKALVIDNHIEFVPDKPLQLEVIKTAYKLHKVFGIDNLTINAQQNNFALDSSNIEALERVSSTMAKLNQSLLDVVDIQDGEIS